MKYRLKDRALQKKLDDISDGDFSRCLNDFFKNCNIKILPFTAICFGQIVAEDGTFFHRFTARVLEDEIEEVPEYDPRAWNKFPEVTPPKEQDMRVEVGEGCGYMAWWDGFNWRTGNHHYEKANFLENVKRFRPWDDCDEGDKK